MEIPNQYIRNLYKVLVVFLVILSVFFLVKVLAEFKSYEMMDSSYANTITVSGHGEVTAVPDIASVNFTIREGAKTAKAAQDAVAVVEKKVLDFLKSGGIEEKDIKTANASVYPKYKYVQPPVVCNEFGCPPAPRGEDVISGYEATESITVKVRKADEVGKIMQGLGASGVSDLTGPNFEIDNEDSLKAQARKKAIEDARQKAEALARDLDVRLGRVANFNESGDYYPMYSKRDMMMETVGNASSAPAVISKGENTISADVTITYEIR